MTRKEQASYKHSLGAARCPGWKASPAAEHNLRRHFSTEQSSQQGLAASRLSMKARALIFAH